MNQDIGPHENKKKDHKFRFCCGREFKSLRGLNTPGTFLNTHRRSCFVEKTPSIDELLEDAVEKINDDIPTNDNENNLIDLTDLPKGEIKKGVFLRNTVQDSESANEFFYNEYTSEC